MSIKFTIALILSAIAALGIFVITFILDSKFDEPVDGLIACTAEAKICPDGTAVGRVGPKCEFAPCGSVASSTATSKVTINLKIGQAGDMFGLTIKPISIIEDSRCPVDVTCIQAGRVRLLVLMNGGLGEYKNTFELGKPISIQNWSVTLIKVLPETSSKSSISSADYRFVFETIKE